MSPADPAILDRVRKLLALAGSPNVHEAALAAERAQALISRHRLEAFLEAEQEIEADPITDGRDAPLEVGRRIRKWKGALASALAEANGAMAWTWDRGEDAALCVVGRARDREAVQALYDALLKRIEWLSATNGPGRDRRWHEAYRIGVATTLAERLQAGAIQARDTLPEAALARIDPHSAAHEAALRRFVEQRFGAARTRGMRVDARAYAAGRDAGKDLSLPGDPTTPRKQR